MTDLTVSERARLEGLEAVIENGLRTFIEVGQALSGIREERLYRATHGTFEDYCRERWDFNDSRARQLIAGAETVTTVTGAGLPAPASERVARELMTLRQDPETLQATWQEAIERHGEKPTAEQVREIVRRPALPAAPPAPAGARALKHHQKLVTSAVLTAENLRSTIGHMDLETTKQLEGESAWIETLREARTAITRLLGALSHDE
jgi:hypothetical protein